jgi:bifunctional DNase/RNase
VARLGGLASPPSGSRGGTAYRRSVSVELSKVSVSDVRVAVAAGPGLEAGLVTLREDAEPHRSVPIVIGQPEARSIQVAWTGAVQSRPSTWDLFVSAVSLLNARLDRAVITDVEENRHFYATIEFEVDGDRRILAARPSDAIALVLRAHGAEIYVAETVLAVMGVRSTDN